jgi:hypothetical protein
MWSTFDLTFNADRNPGRGALVAGLTNNSVGRVIQNGER